jgi:PPOX class probable F420-dependent enzyme
VTYTVNSVLDLPFQTLGGEPGFASGQLDRFLRQPRVAVLAYRRADGSPNQVSVWYDYHDGQIRLSMETSSPKVAALRRDPRVTITIQDERPPYRSVVVAGTVELDDRLADAEASMSMAVRYFGRIAGGIYRKRYEAKRQSAGNTTVTVRPTSVRGFDGTQSVDKLTLGFLRFRNALGFAKRLL